MQSSREAYLLDEIERLQGQLNGHLLDEALHGHVNRYQPAQNVPTHGEGQHVNRTRRLLLPPSAYVVGLGATLTTFGGRYQGWQFTNGVYQHIIVNIAWPADYVSGFSFVYFWMNNGAGSGNVRWRMLVRHKADGEDLSVTDVVDTADVVTAASQNLAKKSTHSASFSPDIDKLVGLMVQRQGTDGTDTLGNSVLFLGGWIDYTADS